MTDPTRSANHQLLRRRALSLALALAILIAACIAGSWLDSRANACNEQVRTEKEQLWEQRSEASPEERSGELDDLILDAWVREGDLEAQASEYRLYARLLRIGGALACGAVILVSRRKFRLE